MGAQVPQRLEVVSSYYFYFAILCAVIPSVSLYTCLIVQISVNFFNIAIIDLSMSPPVGYWPKEKLIEQSP